MQKGHTALLVDVGSANVGVAIAEAEKDRLLLSHVSRSALQNVSGENTAAIATLAIDALRKSIQALNTVSPVPRTAHVVLAAPWYTARIKTILSESQKTLRITGGTVEKALKDYEEKHPESAAEKRVRIESAVSQAYVNGYPTALTKPLHGSSLKISLYESEADGPFVKGITEVLRAGFGSIKLEFHSFPFAAFSVLRALRDEQSFICIDVGGEITDVTVVNRGGLSFTGSFPAGSLSLLRAIAGKGSVADAASRLSLYSKGELSEEESANFKMLFEKGAAAWNAAYQELLGHAALETPLPNTLFLIADKEELRWFESALASSAAAFPAHPTLVTPDFFQSAVGLGEEGSYDAFLSIGALYAFRIKR